MKTTNSLPKISTDTAWFGLVPPKNALIAWGARLVLSGKSWAGFPDRQQWTREHDRKAELKDFNNAILSKPSSKVTEDVLIRHDDGDKHLLILPRGGYGYAVAWIDKPSLKIDPKTGTVTIGTLRMGGVSQNRLGWRFIPFVAGRRSSRKNFPTAEKAIPAWVKRYAR